MIESSFRILLIKRLSLKKVTSRIYRGYSILSSSKREIANFRDLSKSGPVAKAIKEDVAKSGKPQQPAQAKPNSKLEKEIETIEKEIMKMEQVMAGDKFYESAEANVVLEKYATVKKKLEEKIEQWLSA